MAYRMNPNWTETHGAATKAALKTSRELGQQKHDEPRDAAMGRTSRTLYLKSEVGYEHPAKGPHHCSECKHFRSPKSCEIVAGLIRPEDWCEKFEKRS